MRRQNPQATTEQSLMIFSSPSSFWSEAIHENYCSVYLYKFSKPVFRCAINLHQASLTRATSSMAGKVPHNGVNPAQKDSWELLYTHTNTHKLSIHEIERLCRCCKLQNGIYFVHTRTHKRYEPGFPFYGFVI